MYIYKQLDSSFLKYVNYLYNKFPEKLFIDSVTILPVFGGKCDSENLVGSAHKQPWRPPAANMGPL